MSSRYTFAASLALVALVPALMAQSLPASAQVSDTAEGVDQIVKAPAPQWAHHSEPMAVPENAQGAVFVRRQDTIVRLTQTGSRSYQSQIVRLLQPQALQAGNIAIAWNPAAGEAQVHAVRIHRGSRVIDVLESTGFEILRREDQLEQAMLDGTLTASLRVPDLRVGDDLELAYSVPLHDPTLKETSHGLLYMGDSPPAGRFKLELTWEDGQKPKVQLSSDLADIAERQGNSVALRFDNPAVVAPPRNSPPRYAWGRVMEFSDFADWSAVSSRFYTLFKEASTLPADSPLREEAAFIAADHKGKLAQAQAALKLVQQQVRYIYVGLNGGNFTPAHADQTWERRYGDCKGKTAMLLALLSELGIEAEAVLVANNIATDGHDERLANPGLFDHILVRARIDGKDYWLDGTLPAVIEARTEPFLRYQSVLPLAKAGKPLEKLPQRPYAMPQFLGLVEIDASAGFDVPAKRIETSLSRGSAALEEYFSFTSVTADQLEAAMRTQLVGSASWDTIDSVSYRFDRETQASVLTVTGTGPVDWSNEGNGAYDLVLEGGGFSPPSRQVRTRDEGEDVPFWQNHNYTCFVATIKLPKDTDLEDWSFNTVFDTSLYGRLYYRMMEINKDRTLRLVTGSRVEQSEITPARAERDNARLADFDNSKAVLSYSPKGMGKAWGSLKPVPAVSEADWTGANAPCLPADVLKK